MSRLVLPSLYPPMFQNKTFRSSELWVDRVVLDLDLLIGAEVRSTFELILLASSWLRLTSSSIISFSLMVLGKK